MKHAPIQTPTRERGRVAAAWARTPAARRAIAACLSADAQPTTKFETFAQTRDEWREYEGPLAEAVTAAREAWLVAQGGGEGTVRYMRLHFSQASVTRVLDDARRSAF